MVRFHTDSTAYEQPTAVAEQVKFLRRRYSPDEKRICRSADILRPWVFQGLFVFQREGDNFDGKFNRKQNKKETFYHGKYRRYGNFDSNSLRVVYVRKVSVALFPRLVRYSNIRFARVAWWICHKSAGWGDNSRGKMPFQNAFHKYVLRGRVRRYLGGYCICVACNANLPFVKRAQKRNYWHDCRHVLCCCS